MALGCLGVLALLSASLAQEITGRRPEDPPTETPTEPASRTRGASDPLVRFGDVLGRLGANTRHLNAPARVNWKPPGKVGARVVLIYYANETPRAGEGSKNIDIITNWLRTGSDEELGKLADRLQDDRREFVEQVDEELATIRRHAVGDGGPRYPIGVALFTNEMAVRGEYEYYQVGAGAFKRGRLKLPPGKSRIALWNPLTEPVALQAALDAVAERFPPSEYEYVLHTKSHGSATHALTPMLNQDASDWSRESYLKHVMENAVSTSNRRRSLFRAAFGWNKNIGIPKHDYVSTITDAGARRRMYFRLVFADACFSDLSLVMFNVTDPREVPLGILYSSDQEGLEYATLDYEKVFNGEPPAAGFAEAMNRSLHEKHLADLTTARAKDSATPAPSRVIDAPFARFVDLRLLGKAWADLDSGLMTDVALQLLEGETALGRPHRLVSGDDVLRSATRLAAENRDHSALERIARAAHRAGRTALAREAEQLLRLAGDSRTAAPSPSFTQVAMSVDACPMFRACWLDIRAAHLSGDIRALAAIARVLPGLPHLDAGQRQRLVRSIESPGIESGPWADRLNQTINRLAGASGGGNRSRVPLRVEQLLEQRATSGPRDGGRQRAQRLLSGLREALEAPQGPLTLP